MVFSEIYLSILRLGYIGSFQKNCKELNDFRGECIGPLLETTRPAYELKLARLIANLPSSASESSNCFY